jgi:hypothetical protein
LSGATYRQRRFLVFLSGDQTWWDYEMTQAYAGARIREYMAAKKKKKQVK